MKLSEFDYHLPKELIATHPAQPRDTAKLLTLDRKKGKLSDSVFSQLSEILSCNDVLVVNDSKVLPARLLGKVENRSFEVLLVKNISESSWECWVKPGRRAKIGDMFIFSGNLSGRLIKRENEIFIFDFNLSGVDFIREVEKIGEMPIPPYILKARGETHDEQIDKNDYQTVYAEKEGSVAAPTAGLHFTPELLERLENRGVTVEKVTLHVSLGTFQPVNTEKVEDFRIHSEYFAIEQDTVARLNQAKKEGKRIIAVGTTTVRVLESATVNSTLMPQAGETKIFIYPGYKFKFVDAMITNFHLPKSSLLLLVSAFASKEQILSSYRYAINHSYRFYSYGDGMFIY